MSRAAAIAALLLALLVAGGCARAAPGPELAGALVLRAPAAAAAGSALLVVAERADAPDGLAASLLAEGSYGPTLYRARFQGGRAEFRLPPGDTRVAGLVTLTARAGAATGRAELRIAPGPPVSPVTPLLGPRTLIADGAHWGTVVAIPFDAYGNPVAAGTPVRFLVQRPDGRTEQLATPVTHLIAWRRVASATRAGRTTVVVRAGDAHGPDASLVETPGWPAPFALSASPLGLPADGRQLVTLRTAPIVDRHGNQMLDGTLVTFVAEPPGGGPRLIPAYTIDGVAEALLQAPAEPGVVTVRATLFGVQSAPLRLSFAPGPATGSIPVAATLDEAAGLVSIDAGPLLAALGQLVPEGTAVRFTLVAPDGTTRTLAGQAEDGHSRVTLRLAELAPGAYAVTVDAGAGAGAARFVVP